MQFILNLIHKMSRQFVLLSLSLIILSSQAYKFPKNFKFGVATSAYQIEGGWNADGKTASIWDEAVHNIPNLIADGSTANIACNSYNKLDDDIQILKDLKVDFYRFSISWVRIFPEGYTTKINQPGVDYYNKLINKLQQNGIEAIITLYHWDLPQVFGKIGSWTNPFIIEHFANFSRQIFDLFGDRVKTWLTINEPRVICNIFKSKVGYVTPDYPNGIAEYLCAHNLLKAHAQVYHIYDKEFRAKQKGKIAIALDTSWFEPADPKNPEDVMVAEQNRQFEIGMFAHPIFHYDYPKIVKTRVAERSRLEGFPKSRLPEFTFKEKNELKGSTDFLAVNFYHSIVVKNIPESKHDKPDFDLDSGGYKFYHPNWENTSVSYFKVVPESFRKILHWIKINYNNPEIFITENGYSDSDGTLEDNKRIDYLKKHLNSVLEAIYEDNVNITGYTVWSLMDNFEWLMGYKSKFGLYHVNFSDPNRSRIPKKSAKYFRKIIETRSINHFS